MFNNVKKKTVLIEVLIHISMCFFHKLETAVRQKEHAVEKDLALKITLIGSNSIKDVA